MIPAFVLLLSICSVFTFDLDILMPNVAPKTKDSYLCFAQKVDNENSVYITEFIPNSNKNIAHHMLLYGCDEPGSVEKVWNCGEMNMKKGSKSEYKSGPVCKGYKQSIIYAWAMDAPKLVLPEDVAFKIGKDTDVKYLVLQVHYANPEIFKNGSSDTSGIKMVAQNEVTKNVAGTYLITTDGAIRPKSYEYFEAACQMNENKVIHPFAYRTHAHKLGLVTSGYRVRTDPSTYEQEWTEIGRRSPQLPQMFFPASNKMTIKKGDIIAARCTMKNYLDHNVYIGATGDDEMCNFYMMYYVEGDKILDNNMCFTRGPPVWYFENFKARNGKKLDISKIPKDASDIPPQTEEMPNMQHNNHDMKDKNKIDLNQNDMRRNSKEMKQLEDEIYLWKQLENYLNSQE